LARIVIDTGNFSKITGILNVVLKPTGKDLTLYIPKDCPVEGIEELGTEVNRDSLANLSPFDDTEVFVEIGEEPDVTVEPGAVPNGITICWRPGVDIILKVLGRIEVAGMIAGRPPIHSRHHVWPAQPGD
jgi:hypothetical protein